MSKIAVLLIEAGVSYDKQRRQESFCPLDKDLSWKSAYRKLPFPRLHIPSITAAISRLIGTWHDRKQLFDDLTLNRDTHDIIREDKEIVLSPARRLLRGFPLLRLVA